ncbi:MAG: aminopeptidase P family protein [Deltaproteobacteria bacterium]|nr:aminopeptidase P family protein [Deltaproteobacteria bacterium]
MTTKNKHIDRRRAAAEAAWGLTDECVLVAAGAPIPKPGGADQTFPYLPHNEYLWLADRRRPGSVLAFDAHEGWTDFVPLISQAERIWEKTGNDEGVSAEGIDAWVEARRGRPLAVLGCPLPGIDDEPALRERLREGLLAARRPKDDVELELMRRAEKATAAGFAKARSLLVPGKTEREVQIEIEAEFMRAGGDRFAFGTIVASGPNAAVLHFEPSQRKLAAGEMVLIDAGADVEGYACDVTRTYPVGGRFTPEQRDLYVILLSAQEKAVADCRAGVEFKELHLATARDIAAGLTTFGLMRGKPDELVESGASALFFPHGLGHLVGLGIRDASGYLPGRARSTHPVLQYLRCDLPLGEGFVTTIEPGIYFIPALLCDQKLREQHKDRVDWKRVDQMLDFGGFRIEDNVLITKGDPVVLTADIPKALKDISG